MSNKKLEKSVLTPNNADSFEDIKSTISSDIIEKYDLYSYNHAAIILKNAYPKELQEIEEALRKFYITKKEIAMPGGSESEIPKKISNHLRPLNWYETRIQGNLYVYLHEQIETELEDGTLKKKKLAQKGPIIQKDYIDGHKIDYIKGKVALDMEWNSKDQTFDRDLYAFRMFYECGIIKVAILLTRSEKLNEIFEKTLKIDKNEQIVYDKNGDPISCKGKYGASTTWLGKLFYRLDSGRQGGCPVLAIGITPKALKD